MRGPPTYNDQDIPNIPFASSGSNRPRTWRHLLQKAAAALQSVPSLLDKADLFDLEYLALTDSTLAASGAQEVFASSPAHAYAHILFCERSLDRGAPLQIARRGLELDGFTPYLKRRMLFRVVELSYEKVFAILLEMNFSHHHMILGLTYYACRVCDEASGDCRNLPVWGTCPSVSSVDRPWRARARRRSWRCSGKIAHTVYDSVAAHPTISHVLLIADSYGHARPLVRGIADGRPRGL